MPESINYQLHVNNAMLDVVRKVLADASKNGLPGKHYFYITFQIHHPDVNISDLPISPNDTEMTIVLQNYFRDLTVHEDCFSVTLNFNDVHKTLRIPFDAIMAFSDPSVDFGIRFEKSPIKPQHRPSEPEVDDAHMDNENHTKSSENVVSFNRYRK